MGVTKIIPDLHYRKMKSHKIFGPLYQEFLDLPRGKTDEFLDKIARDDLGQIIARTIITTSNFEDTGRQVFNLSYDITSLFSHTKLPKLGLRDVKLPYPCFYIHFPKALKILVEESIVAGVYVSDPRQILAAQDTPEELIHSLFPDEEPRIDFITIFYENKTKKYYGGGAVFAVAKNVEDLEELVGMYEDNISQDDKDVCGVVRIALNLIFYLNSTNKNIVVHDNKDEIKDVRRKMRSDNLKKHKRRQLESRLSYLSSQPIITVIEPSLRIEKESSSMTTGNTKRRHWRRGHFHPYWINNPVGEGKVLVLRWLKPMLVGKGVESVIRDHYEVK